MIIREDTVWGSDDVIHLSEDVQIANGATLSIQSGATVIGNGYEITAFGTLRVGQEGAAEAAHIFNTNFQFGNDYNAPGRIEFNNVEMQGGSFLDANGYARYGVFDVRNTSFESVNGFYIWYPEPGSAFVGNTFDNTSGLSIGTHFEVLIQNNAFLNTRGAYNGVAAIVSWNSSGLDSNIRVIDNTFYSGIGYVLELADGYPSTAIFAEGNYIEDAVGSDGEQFVLDNEDSLTRANDIELLLPASEPSPDTPNINRDPTGSVSMAGTLRQGQILTADTSAIDDPDGPETLSFNYQWLRDGVAVGGANGATYTLAQEDVGAVMSVRVSYIDSYGTNESITSVATAPIVGLGLEINGTPDADVLRGDIGNDTLRAGDGPDTLIGGDGDDFLFGGDSEADLRDIMYGGNGNDSLDGSYGNDELRGDAGNDTLIGGFGADTVLGGDDDDVLTGQAWGDVLFGGNGDDFINGGFGYDRVNGGDGADTFYHLGVAGHGSDWIQDYDATEGDVLQYGGSGASLNQFQVNFTETANAGVAGVEEAFVIYRPTGQILWALVDGGAQASINIVLDETQYDLLA